MMVKTDGCCKWRFKHNLIWEAAHGPIPEDCRVIFKDGDRTNFAVDNLALVTKGEHAVMIKCNLRGESPELMEAGILAAGLKLKINELKRKKEGMRGK